MCKLRGSHPFCKDKNVLHKRCIVGVQGLSIYLSIYLSIHPSAPLSLLSFSLKLFIRLNSRCHDTPHPIKFSGALLPSDPSCLLLSRQGQGVCSVSLTSMLMHHLYYTQILMCQPPPGSQTSHLITDRKCQPCYMTILAMCKTTVVLVSV